jgi:hypothetical protein
MRVFTSVAESRFLLRGIIWFCIVAWQLARALNWLGLTLLLAAPAHDEPGAALGRANLNLYSIAMDGPTEVAQCM